MRRATAWLAVVLLVAPFAAPSAAHHPGAPARVATVPDGVRVPEWMDLSPAQRHDLQRFAGRWNAMPAWRRVQVLERWHRWQAISPAERETLRRGETNFRSLPPALRAQMRRSLAAVARLPPPEQRRLRGIWRQLSPDARRRWLERGGPGLSPTPAR